MTLRRPSTFIVALALAVATSMMLMANPAEAATCKSYQYARGGYSTCIGYIQRMLNGITAEYSRNTAGYCPAMHTMTTSYLTVDNSFGPATENKVKSFQYWSCLSTDGVVGPKTWSNLCAYAINSSDWYTGSSSAAVYQSARSAARSAGC